MITQKDRDILQDVGRKHLLDIVIDSEVLKNKLTFIEQTHLCNFVMELDYEDVISLTITEDIKDFENKFSKFIKYGMAAIAGGIVGSVIAGPPLAMFVLYLFRKLSDTCSRSCFNRLPMSSERKICRYECQVAATKRITDQLRSEITKCNQFAKPDKCEKRLRGEYIKWSRRLQQQIVKLNQSKLSREEKDRKRRLKDLAKRAKEISSENQFSKKKLQKIVSENLDIRNKLSFKDHVYLYKVVSSLSEERQIVKPPKIDPQKEKWARSALYLGLWLVPIPFFNDVINYIIKKHNFACAVKCIKQQRFSRSLCIQQCSYFSAQYAVKMLKSQLSKCNKANKPIKCKNKIYKMLGDWKQREIEAKIRYKNELRKEKVKIASRK